MFYDESLNFGEFRLRWWLVLTNSCGVLEACHIERIFRESNRRIKRWIKINLFLFKFCNSRNDNRLMFNSALRSSRWMNFVEFFSSMPFTIKRFPRNLSSEAITCSQQKIQQSKLLLKKIDVRPDQHQIRWNPKETSEEQLQKWNSWPTGALTIPSINSSSCVHRRFEVALLKVLNVTLMKS